MEYKEEDYLQLSGIQHFAFCRRQWALIHLENQWNENLRTVQGRILHNNVHDSESFEKRGSLLISRGMPICSRILGISGTCDVVEFKESKEGIRLHNRNGTWLPVPVEYKKGKPKDNDSDNLQLCCQAICIEEMLLCPQIESAYLYYGEPAKRELVYLDSILREKCKKMIEEMHMLYARKYTPIVKPSKSCNACSLKDICLPKILKAKSASEYLSKRIGELP